MQGFKGIGQRKVRSVKSGINRFFKCFSVEALDIFVNLKGKPSWKKKFPPLEPKFF
jgi:hypothetical protein